MKPLSLSFIAITIGIGLISCNSDTKQLPNNEKITDEIFILNSISLEDINQNIMIPTNDLIKGDTLLIKTGINIYSFGKDSIHGKTLTLFDNSKLVFDYSSRKRLVFNIYDSLGKFVDRGMLPEEVVVRLKYDYVDLSKANFYNKLMKEREKNYEIVAKKYAISRYELDGLVQDELDKKQKDN